MKKKKPCYRARDRCGKFVGIGSKVWVETPYPTGNGEIVAISDKGKCVTLVVGGEKYLQIYSRYFVLSKK